MPKEKFELDLEKLKNVLEINKFKTKAYTGTLLSVEKECKINIYTSGKGGVFTPGIPIGEIKIEDDNIKILSFSDLDQITFDNESGGKMKSDSLSSRICRTL